jgi:hypothetical protein
MLWNRILGAFLFRAEAYEDVEKDTSFTTTAWVLVFVVHLLSFLGAGAPRAATEGVFRWLLAAILGAVIALLAFALAAYVITLVGQGLYNAEVTFYEMVRTLGLASVWNIVGVLGVITLASPGLGTLGSLLFLIASILALAAWIYAAKRALDLTWGKTLVTVFLGAMVFFAITELLLAVASSLGLEIPRLSGVLSL